MANLWETTDNDNVICVFSSTEDLNRWQLEMTQGPFSGYPVIDLEVHDLIRLYRALSVEILNNIMPNL